MIARVLLRQSVRDQTKKGKEVNGFGNKDKNRKFGVIDLEQLSVRCCRVVIAKRWYVGMSRGVARAPRCSIYRTRLGPATSAEHSRTRMRSPTIRNVSFLNQMSASREKGKVSK